MDLTHERFVRDHVNFFRYLSPMEISPGSDTYRFFFEPKEYPGWKLSSKLPNLYKHHDGIVYGFVGRPLIDSIRKTKFGNIEVIITDYPRVDLGKESA